MKRYISKNSIILLVVIAFANIVFIPDDYTILNKEAIKVELTYRVEERDGSVKITVNTNLPDDTYLMISIGHKDNNLADTYQMYQSVKVSVKGGKAETDWLNNSGKWLKPGMYELSISTPMAEIQPENVRKEIGEKGQRLSGVHVDTSRGDGSRIVDLDELIEIKGKTK